MRKRIFKPNSFYHIYNRGNHRNKIFYRQSDYARFVHTMFRLKKEYSFIIYSFCLMPNHYHLLVNTGSKPEEIPKYMHRFMSSYSKYFNKRHNVVGHLFQSPYRSSYVSKEKGFSLLNEYIRNNPIKAGIVSNIECYKWYKGVSLSDANMDIEEES